MSNRIEARNEADAHLDALLDELIELEVREARIAERRARLVNDVRSAVTAAEGAQKVAVSIAGWSAEVVARRTIISELAAALRLPERAAENLMQYAWALETELPATRRALAEGRITYRHATTLIDQAWSLPVEARGGFEDAVLAAAEVRTVEQFRQRARIVRERLHPDSIEERRTAAIDARRVTLEPARDGMACLTALLPAEQAFGICERLTDIARSLESENDTEPDGSGRRTLAQGRADVLADLLLDGVIPSSGLGRGVHAKVLVTVPVLTLLGRPDAAAPAELEGYGPIDDATARRLAAHAPSFTRLLTHPETQTVLSVGRERYSVPSDLRLWLRVRDGTCRFPGCGRSAARSEIDHTLDWQFAGQTAHDNLAHLCPSHHRLKHHTDWSVHHLEHGVLEWRSPSGRTYSTHPTTVMPARVGGAA
ncbi:MAG: DUF222 domain-containing protein [Microcella sp.]|uniref:HNH endonuclease signature motif containing protein n=1 Tax=Microcella sp. TaxID=1913979 RepID=UPI0024C5BB7A|nr:HNH endonuclease signature motif containing protein [Microcella sp.]UYN84179.1 MAG: DUF222 domain-containing protein [Microcella sp.]